MFPAKAKKLFSLSLLSTHSLHVTSLNNNEEEKPTAVLCFQTFSKLATTTATDSVSLAIDPSPHIKATATLERCIVELS